MSVGDASRADVRVSDAEREIAVEGLRQHHAEGRLTLDEFTERVECAYRARTQMDLEQALRDLPPDDPVAESPRRRRRRRHRLPMWWIRVNVICTAIWGATCVGSGLHYFWPMWVMLGTSIPAIAAAGHGRRQHSDDPAASIPDQPGPSSTLGSRVVSSVLFVDIVESTEHAVSMGDREWNGLLESYLSAARDEIAASGGREVFSKGDETVAAFATPAAAVRCGAAIRVCARTLDLDIRAGVHAGEVDAHGQEIRGLAMHIGQRICATAQPGQLLVSSTVRDLLAGSNLTFTDAGEHELKGLPGPWRLYAVPA